ncbi:lytic murein transglycosylase [Aeromicrobium sp. NPDC092404]|uniref:lytic transglycosylase domain-containing protein n=1 Tax=Aeromicrobium sp. NPDC092404 TaxID=3154976 RepID=UPI00341B1412
MSDDAARRERRITGAIAVTALLGVAALVVAAGLLVKSPPSGPRAAPTPTTTMKPVKPVSEAVAPAPTPSGERISAAWLSDLSRRTGIGTVALEAYALASVRLAREQPGCHVGWSTLAGIGSIESGHGTFGGSRVEADGDTTRPIVGPPLDGTSGTARIPSDEESEKWHGDTEWDRAMGPMQFIPSTWRRWESDGNDDGTADPNNIVDAAYAAARYLCASGRDLRTGEGWTQAVFSYNHSEEYVRNVVARTNSFVDS